MVYAVDDNESNDVHFKRIVNAQGNSEYRINDKVVAWEDYDKKLKEINILVKARNFLVFQVTIYYSIPSFFPIF